MTPQQKIWIINDEEGMWVTNAPSVMQKAVDCGEHTYNILEVIVDAVQQPIVDLVTGEEIPWRFI